MFYFLTKQSENYNKENKNRAQSEWMYVYIPLRGITTEWQCINNTGFCSIKTTGRSGLKKWKKYSGGEKKRRVKNYRIYWGQNVSICKLSLSPFFNCWFISVISIIPSLWGSRKTTNIFSAQFWLIWRK